MAPGVVIDYRQALEPSHGLGSFVTILHNPGSLDQFYATYAHLTANSVLFEPKDRGTAKVVAGERLALSGDTGVGTGPHLHVQFSPTIFTHPSSDVLAFAADEYDYLLDFNGTLPASGEIVTGAAEVSATDVPGAPGYADIVQKAYIAYYGRPADPAGLSFWIDRLEQAAGDLGAIIEDFGNSIEFVERFGNLTNQQLIVQVYQQLLGRSPDPAGSAFYLSKLDNNEISLQTFTLDVLFGATGADVATINNKLVVANFFTDNVDRSEFEYAGSMAAEQASALISDVNWVDDPVELVASARDFFDAFDRSLPSDIGALPVGGVALGRLEVPSDEDWFATTLQANTTYLFTLSSDELETPYLRLRDSDGSSLESDFQSSDEAAAVIGFTPLQAGIFYLEASDLGDDATGAYSLAVSESGTTDDYADDESTTGTIAVGASVSGTIEVPADRDWFTTTLEANTTYLFTLSSDDLETPYLRLRDSDGSSLESDFQSSDETAAIIGFTPLQTGIFYLEASDLGDDSTGAYSLAVSESGTTDDYADDESTIGVIAVNASQPAAIEVPADKDWFATTLQANTTYLLAMSSDELETPYLRLRDSNGRSLESDFQSSREARAEIGFTPSESGTYYLEASSLGGDSTGLYLLGVALSGTVDDFWPG
jgi:hypothetical protein